MVAACFMAYFHLNDFEGTSDTFSSLMEIADVAQPDKLLYPSQIRQMQYFDEILNGFIVSLILLYFINYSP